MRQPQWQPAEKASIARVIGRVFDLQKQYGKTTSQLETIVDGFLWALAGYSVEQVTDGFRKYISRKSDMPTPADIINIIDPIKEPWRPDKSYYIKLQEIFKREGPYGLGQDEIDYIYAYEDYMRKERAP